MLIDEGRTVTGIDRSKGRLSRVEAEFPNIRVEKVGLQEMGYHEAFDGAICMDAIEHICPEDWPRVLSNFHRALKPRAYMYFTVEVTDEKKIEAAFTRGQELEPPVVFGELADEDVYHYYPSIQQVREWLEQARFEFMGDGDGDSYHHFMVCKV
ncbi:MAG: class I SAM-dependent methyltransferase [Anaerolineales bacterium]|jgi:cyclopropane fatty-acyl-phospholipid synthase-like methyltransferase